MLECLNRIISFFLFFHENECCDTHLNDLFKAFQMSNHACVNGEIRKFYEIIILFRGMMESERNRKRECKREINDNLALY